MSDVRVGIVGASGYTGVELLRILHGHPGARVTWLAAGRAAGTPLVDAWPGLVGLTDVDHFELEALDAQRASALCDVVFLALPHGISAGVAPSLLDAGVTVIDLGADFRLRDPAVYEAAYKQAHPCPALLEQAVYGLVERSREALRGARLVANPGCYPTAVGLAAGPLVDRGWAGDWLVADCLSGVSGAGRKAGTRNLFCEVGQSVSAYGVGGVHRHVPEIEQTLGRPISFTPHLVPMTRGMLATVHARPASLPPLSEIRAAFDAAYADEAMVVMRDTAPSTADAVGTNRAHLFVTTDPARGVITVVSVIDNLVKGAAGQAVQCMNVALGLEETAGLPVFPVLP